MNLSTSILSIIEQDKLTRDITSLLKSRHLSKDKVSAYQVTLPLPDGTLTTIVAYNAGFPNLTSVNVFTLRVYDFLRTRMSSHELLKLEAGIVNPRPVDLGKKVLIPTNGLILIDHNGRVAHED